MPPPANAEQAQPMPADPGRRASWLARLAEGVGSKVSVAPSSDGELLGGPGGASSASSGGPVYLAATREVSHQSSVTFRSLTNRFEDETEEELFRERYRNEHTAAGRHNAAVVFTLYVAATSVSLANLFDDDPEVVSDAEEYALLTFPVLLPIPLALWAVGATRLGKRHAQRLLLLILLCLSASFLMGGIHSMLSEWGTYIEDDLDTILEQFNTTRGWETEVVEINSRTVAGWDYMDLDGNLRQVLESYSRELLLPAITLNVNLMRPVIIVMLAPILKVDLLHSAVLALLVSLAYVTLVAVIYPATDSGQFVRNMALVAVVVPVIAMVILQQVRELERYIRLNFTHLHKIEREKDAFKLQRDRLNVENRELKDALKAKAESEKDGSDEELDLTTPMQKIIASLRAVQTESQLSDEGRGLLDDIIKALSDQSRSLLVPDIELAMQSSSRDVDTRNWAMTMFAGRGAYRRTERHLAGAVAAGGGGPRDSSASSTAGSVDSASTAANAPPRLSPRFASANAKFSSPGEVDAGSGRLPGTQSAGATVLADAAASAVGVPSPAFFGSSGGGGGAAAGAGAAGAATTATTATGNDDEPGSAHGASSQGSVQGAAQDDRARALTQTAPVDVADAAEKALADEDSAADDPTGAASVPDVALLPGTQLCDRDASLSKVQREIESQGWNVDTIWISEVTGGRPLQFSLWVHTMRHGFLGEFGISPSVLVNFASEIEGGYLANPYHNGIHAADVTNSVNYLLSDMGRDAPGGTLASVLQQSELFASLVAAAIHDFKHPGKSNAFMIKARTDLAVQHNDSSVLERMHVSEAFFVARRPECNVFAGLDDETFGEVRKLIIDLVLATDMANHMAVTATLKTAKLNGTPIAEVREDCTLLMKTVLKCADIAHSTKVLRLHLKWSGRIIEEFFQQGDVERERGMAISPFMDRQNENSAKNQIGFFDFCVLPFYDVAKDALLGEGFQPVADQIKVNYQMWRDAAASDVLDIGGITEFAKSRAAQSGGAGGEGVLPPV